MRVLSGLQVEGDLLQPERHRRDRGYDRFQLLPGLFNLPQPFLGDAEGGFAASYMAYSGVSGVAGVANAWIPIGGPVSTASINVHDLAGRADMNTIRFKVSDDDPADLV